MPPLSPALADHAPLLRATEPALPLLFDARPPAMRQRVVNYAAKRLVDMMFVTGLDRDTALRHFRHRPAAIPGSLRADTGDAEHAAEADAAWHAGRITVADDATDRRITVTWADPAFPAPAVGMAIARDGFGGILLGPHGAPAFDPAPLPRPARPDAAGPRGDGGTTRPAPALEQAADAFLAGSPGLYGVMAATPGAVLLERYGAHGAPGRPTPSWSMTKAVTATIIGRLLHEGWLGHVDDPAPAPLWQDPRGIHRLITLDHLLRMRSGLAFPILGADGGTAVGFENTLVYSDAADAFETAQRAIVATVPGGAYRYVNTGLNVLGAIIRDQIERRGLPYYAALYGLLADRIGMASYQHSADRHGNLIASGSGFATMRDYARLGLLYAQDGVWDGERLLPEGWVDTALAPSHAHAHYAACFRTNTDETFPSLPRDTAWASGASDQMVIILRRQRLVVCTTNETDHPIDTAALDRLCAAAVRHVEAGGRALAAE